MSTGLGTEDRKRLGVRVLTPEGPVYEGDAAMVIAPSVEGEVGILPRHAPLIADMRIGETRIRTLADEVHAFATTEGYLSVEDDQVLVLVEHAEPADSVDRARAAETLRQAEEALAAAGDDDQAREAAERAVRRAQSLLRVADMGAGERRESREGRPLENGDTPGLG